jgi:cellobiose-specific phosphotransferase system component IIC
MKTARLTILNTIAFLAMLITNYLSATLPLNGATPGELSDKYVNLFVPAGFTFSIWGLIYLLLAVWVGSQLITQFKEKKNTQIVDNQYAISTFFILNTLFNIAWLFAWHWQYVALSVVLMIGILATLVMINTRIYTDEAEYETWTRWVAQPAFGIYQGWITVALIANATTLLITMGWRGAPLSEEIWTVLMIGVGASLALLLAFRRGQLWHCLAVAWALYGIYSKRTLLGDSQLVAQTALISMFILLFVVAAGFMRRLRN